MLLIFWTVVAALALFTGAALATHEHLRLGRAADMDDRSGWVYFLSGPDTAIKVGNTHRDPTKDRLPEIRTMSPVPLRIIYKFRASNRFEAETAVHRQLANSRQHGEWFERDATLAFIDYLKGSYE